jgi:hypothetical protein
MRLEDLYACEHEPIIRVVREGEVHWQCACGVVGTAPAATIEEKPRAPAAE